MPKNIIVLADGTGNSAASLAKTNVWRLYRALDLSRAPASGQLVQVAIYRDGVGTSAFRPLSMLGGIFGLGLSRNVVELYKFLCRTYEPGDRIYAFGFSRGAFTVRVLVGLVLDQKLLPYRTKEELDRYAPDAYRSYRRRYKLPLFGSSKADYEANPGVHRDTKVGLVDRLRDLRDWLIRVRRRIARQPQFETIARQAQEVEGIAFLGVWDTVAAYGLPLDELTRGIDEWVWPLSMPNNKLHPKVHRARHALALDEERDSFRPMLWDESDLPPPALDGSDRLLQVWFAGVHSNVGGGYPDDTLSYVPLEWMLGEAAAAGLRLNDSARCEAYPPPNPHGRVYDSRAGVGGYYRYQPRRLSSMLLSPKPDTLILRDPRRGNRGFLHEVLLHESVVERIANGTDHYAPVSMADSYRIVRTSPPSQQNPPASLPAPVPTNSPFRKWLWNDVWQRRVNYFATVLVSVLLAVLPAIESAFPPAACEGPQCLLSGPIHAAGVFLPGFASTWIDAFARAPGTFLILIVLLALLAINGRRLAVRIGDDARALWFPPQSPPPPYRDRVDHAIYGLRGSAAYLKGLQFLKWRLGPSLFGILVLILALALPFVVLDIAVVRLVLRHRENTGAICGLTDTAASTAERADPTIGGFRTSAACWQTPYDVERGRRYRVILTVTQAWRDGTIDTSPAGFTNKRMPWTAKLGPLFRRSTADRWFQPILRIKRDGSPTHLQALDFACRCGGDAGRPVYDAEFVARASGRVGLFVNDAPIDLFGLTGRYYANNQGAALVEIIPLPDEGPPSEPAPQK